jgi:uncharacterized delta-60 repeat protein
MRGAWVRIAAALTVCAFVVAGTALAAGGKPDANFGQDGFAVSGSPSEEFGEDVSVLDDGRIVAMGSVNQESQFLLARFDPDGTLDPTFGDEGRVIYEHAGAHTYAEAIETDDEGRIYVGGNFAPPGGKGQIGVVRFTPEGLPDPEWGTDGVATAGALGRVFTEDDNIALDGESAVIAGDTNKGARVARFGPDGELDQSFGSGGVATIGSLVSPSSVAVSKSGKVTVLGSGRNGETGMAFSRLSKSGKLDKSIGEKGILLATFPDFLSIDARSVALDGESAVGAGFAYLDRPGDDTDFALARVSAKGKLDRGFAGDGKVTFDRGKDDTIFDAAIAGDGTIFGSGYTSGDDFLGIAVTPKGKLDKGVGRKGYLLADPPRSEPSHGIALHDGKVFLAGTARLGDTGDDVAVARFTP